MNQLSELILASGSPRRAELLAQIAVRFKVLICDINESRHEDESPLVHVQRLAREKAVAGRRRADSTVPVLGADTIVLLDDEILGKPSSRRHAEQMLARLSGQTHRVLSAVAVLDIQGQAFEAVNITAVTFAKIPDRFIRHYCRSDDPMDKAGAYAVQGLTARYITHVDGSYSGVMGLPLYETGLLLQRAAVIE